MTSLGGRPAVATMLCMTSRTVLPLKASTIRKRQRFCSRHSRAKHATAVVVAATGPCWKWSHLFRPLNRLLLIDRRLLALTDHVEGWLQQQHVLMHVLCCACAYSDPQQLLLLQLPAQGGLSSNRRRASMQL
jgi:hypothetical protein